MGLAGKESTLYLIDFGLARRYRYRENRALTHIPFRRGRNFIGTAKYASLNSHKNIELSRRDDLESLAYVLIELVSGHLPWKNISKRNATTRHQASQRIRGLKELTNWDEFCPPMAKFIKYCREIPFNEEPDYDRLLDLLQLITVLLPEYNSSSISCLGPYAAPAVVAAAAAAARCRAEKKLTPMALPAAVPSVAEAAAAAIMARAVCCQTPETAEKMTQVDFETAKMYANEAAQKMAREAQIVAEEDTETVSVTRVVASTMQRLSMKVAAENGTGSDIEEVGAATTTTSCSDNELLLDSGGGGGCMTGRGGESSATGELRSVVGTAVSDGDDELTADSQPMPQQKRSQQQQQQQQRAISPPPQQPKRVEQSLQTEALLLMPPHKMCWQQARDSNPERRFQYENRFSWTVDKQQQQQHQQGGMIMTTGGPAVDEHHYQQQQQYQQHVQAVHHLQQQQQHVQTVQLQQQHQQQQLAFVHHLHPQQQQQQHYVAPPQFLLQQQANCPNGQISPAHHPFGIVVPNSGVASAAAPVPYQTQATAAASAAAFRAVAATQPPQQHYHHLHHVHNQQLLPAAVAAQFVMPPPQQQPPPVVSQCQQIQMAKFGANLNRPLQQPPPAPVTVVAPPPMQPQQQQQQQHQQQQQQQQQQQRRFMHIAFVLPPPSPAVVDVPPPQAPRAMLAPAGKQNGGSVPNC
uniref:Protein kinase domain-containing protein n=1 Tax=Globodera pallida TaxID=36090 RepID=A0A183BZT5_GLOPA